MEAIATYDFNATAEDELSFSKGSVLNILNMGNDPNWYSAEFNGREGKIPRNYICFNVPEWYEGRMTREKATKFLLNTEQPNGAFLVRDSESTPGDFSLSVKNEDSVEHLKVLRDGAGKYFLWLVKFKTLNELIGYHRSSSVIRGQTLYLKEKNSSNYVKAVYDFEAQGSDELGFKKDDFILVKDKVDTNWWKGELNGKTGSFPVNYVKELN